MVSSTNPFPAYLRAIEQNLRNGDATEHTHRPAVKGLLESLKAGITATNEPKRVACGAPDYAVSLRTGHGPLSVGYVEAKDVGVSLHDAERSEQLKRYFLPLHNLILTDYLEFRWYVDGQTRASARLATVGANGRLTPLKEGETQVRALLRDFLDHAPAPIARPKELAERMARLTHLIRDIIVNAATGGQSSALLRGLRAELQRTLLPELAIEPFADMFAQTLAYGLFAARVNHSGAAPFQRSDAAREIPRSNPFLRRLFGTVSHPDFDDEPFAGFVDDLTQLLSHTDMDVVLADFGKRTRQEDPVVHFYETFLAAYDPQLREKRGVYYTPEPVVSYIVRSVDQLLRTTFGIAGGLADTGTVTYPRTSDSGQRETVTAPRVLVLDPACGTGTFLYAVVDHIRETFKAQGNAGMWSGYVKTHLLPRLFGFELLMAPYAVAHLKLGLQLAGRDMAPAERANWTYDFAAGERLGIYLTNSLEQGIKAIEAGLGSFIPEEANAAAEIKREKPIMVVIGNPPYSGHSANKGNWIAELVADYKKGVPGLDKPAQAKWLQDDYVKFLRFGQWRIQQTGSGVLAFVTNHGYLDNPTFRGMRQQLLDTFTDIYILNLHGNSNKKEIAPDGSRDINVFDIQQGVAVGIFVKQAGKTGPARVHYADLWGNRDAKYTWLAEQDIITTTWTILAPQAPRYLFQPQDTDLNKEYEQGWSLSEAMNGNGDPAPGIVTTQDEFAISWDAEESRNKVRRFLRTTSEDEARTFWKLCSQAQWNYSRAMRELGFGSWEQQVTPILYRPFDIRWTIFDSNVAVHRRERVMRHLLSGTNPGIITTRQTRDAWDAKATNIIAGHKALAAYDINSVFPLYLYPYSEKSTEKQASLSGLSPWPEGKDGRRPNLNPAFVEEMQQRLGLTFVPDGRGDLTATFGPEDIFFYIYAVLHAPGYRSRYAEFLKMDFPRIPLTSDADLFRTLVAQGADLVGLHLMESQLLAHPATRFNVKGSDEVEVGYPKYVAPGEAAPITGEPVEQGRVYINKGDAKAGKSGQYFEGVPPEVWEFHVGGYQVPEKWLKDRRGRKLTYEDISHYQRIVVALQETQRLMDEIDEAIPAWPLA